MIEKIPPQALNVEKTVLASALINKNACESLIENIDDHNVFYSTANQIIFIAIKSLFNTGSPVDIINTVEHLKKTEELEKCGTETYLSELVDEVSTVINIISHIKIIKEKYKLRKWIQLGNEIINMGYIPDMESEQLEADVEKKLMSFSDKEKGKTVHIKDKMGKVFEEMEKAALGKHDGITTGFKGIDDKTGGFYPGDLIILAARPSMGKSAMMNNIAINCWNLIKKPILIFSLEMSTESLIRRMLSSVSNVGGTVLRRGLMNHNDQRKLAFAASELCEKNIYINDDPYLNVYKIRTIAMRLHRKHNFGLIAIDYLQKIRDVGKFENKRIETAEKSAVLKALAKELKIPVIALAQLSRACETRPNKRPILSDLRETGDIEQDADVVSFLFRPFMAGESNDPSEAEFIISKQREGEIGTVPLSFNGAITTFTDLTENDDEDKNEYSF